MESTISPNRAEFEDGVPLFVPEARMLQEESGVTSAMTEQTEAGSSARGTDSDNGQQQDPPKKRRRSTKAETSARRKTVGEPHEVHEESTETAASLERNLPLMEAVFRISMELSCPKKNVQVDAGSGTQWHYRNVEDIIDALKPLMLRYGVFVTFSTSIECIGELNYVCVKATARNLSGETFSTKSYAREDFTRPGDWAAQITGSCESYAKKYALQSMFMIDNSKLEAVADPDATSNKAPLRNAAGSGKDEAVQLISGQKAGLREMLKPLLTRGCGDWMTRAADAANWKGSREEYALKVRRNYRISEDDLLILLSAISETTSATS